MSEKADCPPPDQLHRALHGELPSDRAAAIEQHLLECGSCAEQTLHTGDLQTYSQALRESAQQAAEVVPSADTEQLELLIDRLRSLPHQHEVTQLSGITKGSGFTDLESNLIRYLQPARSDEELGWLGTYRVLKLLGSGGMGGVFLAEDTQLHRRVALKVMRPDVSGQANADERFLREARAAAAVHHDHIVTIFQVGRDGQVPFLAMEFLEGESLEDRLRREQVMPLSDILRIGREIAEGLAAAHSRGLVHRDIKPANIWLEARGGTMQADAVHAQPSRVKLLDFGLARAADANFELTSQGVAIGTPAYMAPEQAAGDLVGHRADLFSFGVVLYRLATGALPFQGKDAISTLVAIKSDTPDDPRLRRQDLPQELSDLILRLLKKNPDERPESAVDVAKQLARIALPASGAEIPLKIPAPVNQAKPPAKRFLRRIGAAFLFLALLCGIVVIATDRGQVEVVIDAKDYDVDVQVVVTRPDGYFQVFDKLTGSQVKGFWSGKYEVVMKGDTNSFQVNKNDFVLKRGQIEILTVTRRPTSEVPSKVVPIKMPADLAQLAPISEPPQLSEWLKGRKVLTVAQDGSGQFKTIQAALDALQTGDVVKVLDKGPYRERLDVRSPPDDTGLITDQRAVIELPEWKYDLDLAPVGHIIRFPHGFRLHGFVISVVELPTKPSLMSYALTFNQPEQFVLEQCSFQFPAAPDFGIVVGAAWWNPAAETRLSVIRDCDFGGALTLNSISKGKIGMIRNWFHGQSRAHIYITDKNYDLVLIRENVFAGKSATRDIMLSLVEDKRIDKFEISNNTMLSSSLLDFTYSAPLGKMSVINNLRQSPGLIKLSGDAVRDLPRVSQGWQVGHNSYPRQATIGEHVAVTEGLYPQSATDLLVAPSFLATTSSDPEYLRLPAASPLATGGAGGDWPKYIGALSPGPVPKDGDWFTRLQERRGNLKPTAVSGAGPVQVDEPPPMAEWLIGRKVLTVAQDGSGQFKTIQAALDALQPGETVKVLDRGPYREWLSASALPPNSGLVTEVQTILEGPVWKLAGQEDDQATGGKVDIYGGHLLNAANGFRLHGFEMRFPPSNGKRVQRCGGTRTKGFVLENCFIHASDSYDGERLGFSDWHEGDGVGMSLWIRDCVIEGSVVVVPSHRAIPLHPDRQSTAVIERNYFPGVGTRQHLMIIGESMRNVAIRHNVFAGKSGTDINLSLFDASDSLEVTNNLLLSPTAIAFQERAPRGAVIIRNNIHTQDSIVYFSTGLKLRETARSWNMDHNAYPDLRDRAASEHLLPRPPGDLVTLPRFLSKVPQERDYLRIPADDPLAKAGAGGALPEYLGALVPGPAPKEGDWFSRLHERWLKADKRPAAATPAPPPLVD
jgi:serine/threonine protein kinase